MSKEILDKFAKHNPQILFYHINRALFFTEFIKSYLKGLVAELLTTYILLLKGKKLLPFGAIQHALGLKSPKGDIIGDLIDLSTQTFLEVKTNRRYLKPQHLAVISQITGLKSAFVIPKLIKNGNKNQLELRIYRLDHDLLYWKKFRLREETGEIVDAPEEIVKLIESSKCELLSFLIDEKDKE